MDPFVKLYKKFLDWEWYSDINTSRLFLHILLSANWKDGSFKGKAIARGQLVSSVSILSEKTSLTINEVRTALKHLQSTNEITSKSYSKYTVFTVVRYNSYQSINKQNHEQITSTSTNKSQAESQTDNKLLTTIEEVKKERIKDIKDIVENAADDDLKFQADSFEIECVDKIIKSCHESFPNPRVPDTLAKKQKWAAEIDRMKRIDNITEKDITKVLDYAINDSFWKGNIRSTGKFREKYETLYIQMKRNKSTAANNGNIQKNRFHNFDQRNISYDDSVQDNVMSWLKEN